MIPQVQGPRTLRRKRLADETADALRDMILVGELRPGVRYTQDGLAALMGVSTMPVREALLWLTHEGLVQASPNRSFRIVRITRDDIRDIYWVHSMLAGELAARAAARIDEEGLVDLRRLLEANLAATRRGDVAGMQATNWSFHRAINRAAESPKLALILRRTLSFIPHNFYSLLPDWRRLSEGGHRLLVASLERHNTAAAQSAAAQHVEEAGRLLIMHFSENGHWLQPQDA
jgi:DNA-binding GntR family transcriptional regulator